MLTARKVFLMLLAGYSVEHIKCRSGESKPNKDLNNSSETFFPSEQKNNPSNRFKKSEKTNMSRTYIPSYKCNAKICPEGLKYFYSESDDTSSYCYSLTEPQTFPPKCPYPLFLTISDGTPVGSQFEDVPLWFMIMRNTTDGFGPFEWISKTTGSYGYYYSNTIRQLDDIALRNCMILVEKQIKPVKCTDKYRSLCIYPYSHEALSKYCQTNYANSDDGYLGCIADSIDIENHSCYCERIPADTGKTRLTGLRNYICDTLAEPLTIHQGDLLTYKFKTVHETCWIGLYVDKTEVPRWTVSDKPITYDCWSEDLDLSKSFGATQFDSAASTRADQAGWILADNDDDTIQCGICELKNTYDKNVSLRLTYIPTSNTIELRIKNPYEISDNFGENYLLYCFGGPSDTKVREQIWEIIVQDFDGSTQDEWVSHFNNRYKHPVYYWCEAFQHPNLKQIYSNTIVVYNSIGGYEYAFQIKVRTVENKDPYIDEKPAEVRSYILEKLNWPYECELRVMKVLKYDQESSYMDVIFHLTTGSSATRGDQEELEEYKTLSTLLNNLFSEDDFILKVEGFGRCDVCLPSTTHFGGVALNWPKTAIGAVTLPLNLCLQGNGEPVTRKCGGGFLNGGAWYGVIGECRGDVALPEKTHELNDLLNRENATAAELSGNLSRITEDNQGVTIVDVYLISEILEKLEGFGEEVNISDVIKVISNVMKFERQSLSESQEMLNSTDKILYSLDNILANSKTNNHSVIASPRVLLQINDVTKTDITGVALQGNPDDSDFDSFSLIPLYKNTSIESLLEDNIELAAFLPEGLIDEIENCTGSENPTILAMVLFYNDVLFNENVKQARQTNSRVISISVPNFFCTFSTPIAVIYRPLHNVDFEKKCAHWNYGKSEVMENIRGRWLEDSKPQDEGIPNSTNSYAICEFDHLTHFALLMMGSLTKGGISEEHTLALDIITAIGTILSLASILIMFIIAMVCKSWRERSSNKVLLNFSMAIALQLILLYVAKSVEEDGIWCILIGASLHYTILSEFSWMLVIAILQYRKFVIVFQNPIPHLLAKTCAICWFVPLVPIGILLAVSNESYKKNPHGLCYPLNEYFYFGVLLPITLVVIVNSFIFIRIIAAVCCKKSEAYGSTENDRQLQVFLALFLFFLLGISWVFGLALSFGGGVTFSYLFCFTATFQGLVMFMFFVVMNEQSKTLWAKVKRAFSLPKKKRRTSSTSCSQTQVTDADVHARWRMQSCLL